MSSEEPRRRRVLRVPRTLRTRLILAAAYVLIVVTIGLEVPLAVTVSNRELRQEQSRVLTFAALLAARINDDVPKASPDPNVASSARLAVGDLVALTARTTAVRFVVVDRDGRVLADSENSAAIGALYGTPDRPEFEQVFSKPGGEIEATIRPSETLNQDLLIVTVPVVHNREAIGAVRASESLGAIQARVHRMWLGYALVGAVAIAAGLVATWFLATSLARPVRMLEEAAVRLGRGDLQARALPGGTAEISTLADSFNQMANTLSANISAQQEFLANASHQLRTPLTGLRLRLEAIGQEGGFAAEQAGKAEAEVDRLAGLVEDLLVLARAASVQSTGGPVDLNTCARDAVDRWAATAASQGKTLAAGRAEPAEVWAEPADVDHVLDNLIENAIRYTPDGTTVGVEVRSVGPLAVLAVSDDGPGIPPEDRTRIFERFYRGSTGRRSGSGTGLGLAIVDELVRRWGGEVRLGEGPGTRFEASFPRLEAGGRTGARTPSTPAGPAVS